MSGGRKKDERQREKEGYAHSRTIPYGSDSQGICATTLFLSTKEKQIRKSRVAWLTVYLCILTLSPQCLLQVAASSKSYLQASAPSPLRRPFDC